MSESKIIAITNQKGGVAKSTTTVNLGVGLVKLGKKVLVIDADPQGSLTVSLGYKNPDEIDNTLSNLMQNILEETEFNCSDYIIHHPEGIDLIPSNIELSGMEISLFNAINREQILSKCIAPLGDRYDYILIDCMPSLGLMTINALSAADSVLIPCQPNFLSTKGLNLLLKSISKVKRQINPDLDILGILLTMVDGRTNNAKIISSSLRETVGADIRVFNTEIPHSVKIPESSLIGKSILFYDKRCKASVAYEELSREVALIEGH